MDAETARALNAINRAFYRDQAQAFDSARQDPWPGWIRVLELLERDPPPRPWTVLDVGCGNARLAAFLDTALATRGERFEYLGVDASAPLLARAGQRQLRAGRIELRRADWVDEPAERALPEGAFSLVALFGVLNHVPGSGARQALLSAAARRLAPGGALVWTAWRFDEEERFRTRLVPWDEYNRRAERPVDTARLEAGDRLMRWGASDDGPVRYFHSVDEGENRRLAEALGLEVSAAFADDGREQDLNRYTLLRAPLSAPGQAGT